MFSVGIIEKPSTYHNMKTLFDQLPLPEPVSMLNKPAIPECKKSALTSMLPYMNLVDRQYYKAVKLVDLPENEQRSPVKRQRINYD